MTDLVETLKQLHEFQHELDEVREKLHRGPLQLKGRETELGRREQQIQADTEKAKRMQVAAHEREVALKSGEQKVHDLKVKLNLARSNKEFNALQDEISQHIETNRLLEEEILTLISEQEAKSDELAGEKKQFAQATGDFARFKETTEYTLAKLRDRVGLLEKKITECEASLDPVMRDEYHRLVKTKGAEALAGCEDAFCQSCFTQQTPQTWAELMMGKIAVCPSCGSMLYKQ